MKANLELKSHYVLSIIRMLQEQYVLVSSQKYPSKMEKKITTSNYRQFKKCVYQCVNFYVLIYIMDKLPI